MLKHPKNAYQNTVPDRIQTFHAPSVTGILQIVVVFQQCFNIFMLYSSLSGLIMLNFAKQNIVKTNLLLKQPYEFGPYI